MDWRTVRFDWNQARAFLVTAEEGSLSAAARALGLTQPTLGRQVAALEADLGVALFERVGRSLALTPSGIELLDHVRAMGDAAGRLSLTASGRSQAIEGQVSITAADAVSAYQLPPILQRLRARAPGIEIEVVASNELQDLRRREADIAVRHVRPEDPDLIARLVRETPGHVYASSAYLDRHGRPRTAHDLADAPFIGYGSFAQMEPFLVRMGLSLSADNFPLMTNSSIVGLQLVKLGLGYTVLTADLAALNPELEKVLPDGLESIPVPIWLTTHRELHSSRRIRLVFDFLAEAFA